MTIPRRRWDPWSVATLVLWIAFFAIGFLPEESYSILRWAGRVVTQNALVNSPYLVTMGFSGYLGFFAFQRCREAGQSTLDSQGRALQVFIVGLLAFLNIPLQALRDVQDYGLAHQRNLMYVVFACKSLACMYLVSLMVQFYLLGKDKIFAHLISVFPSTYIAPHASENLAEPRSVVWLEQDSPQREQTPAAKPGTPEPKESNNEPVGP